MVVCVCVWGHIGSVYGGKRSLELQPPPLLPSQCGCAAVFQQRSETKLFHPLVGSSAYISGEGAQIVMDWILSCCGVVVGPKAAHVCLLGLTYPAIFPPRAHWYSCSCYSLQSAAEEL